MPRLRNDQFQSLRDQALDNFHQRLFEHLAEAFPEHLRVLGEPALRAGIRLAPERSAAYGISTERDVAVYTTLMLLLGSFFDVDPLFPWARKILMDDSITDSRNRVEILYHRAIYELNETAGADGEHLRSAYLRFVETPRERFIEYRADTFYGHLGELLEWLDPLKFRVCGPEAIRRFMQLGVKQARGYDIDKTEFMIPYILIMFLFGSGLHRDPFFAWAPKILNRRWTLFESRRIDKLYEATLVHLRSWLNIPGEQGEDR